MRVQRGRIPLKLALTAPFVALTLMAMGVSGYLAYVNGRRAVNDVADQLQQAILTRIENRLISFFKTPHQINSLNSSAISGGALSASDAKVLERNFSRQVDSFDSVSSIYFGNTKGGLVNSGREPSTDKRYIMISKNFSAGDLEKYAIDSNGSHKDLLASIPGFDARTRPWFTGAADTGKAAWSPIYILSTGQDMAIAASQPVYDKDKKLLGVVSVDVFTSQISRFLQNLKFGEHGQCFIIDRSGLLVASSTDLLPFTLEEDSRVKRRLEAGQSKSELIREASKVLAARAGNWHTLNGMKSISFTVKEKRYFLDISPFRHGVNIDWLIGVVVSESDFIAQIEANNRHTALIGLAVFLLLTVMGLVAARRIAGPVLGLYRSSRSIADGKWPKDVRDDSAISEIAELTRAFNKMASTLHDTMESLSLEIGERARAEVALRESESNFRSLFESIGDMIVVANQEGLILYANPALAGNLGYGLDELAGMHVLDLNPKEMRQEAKEIFQDVLLGRRNTCPLPLVSKTGRLIPAETRAWFGTWGGVDCLFGLSKNLGKDQELLQMFDRMFRHNPVAMAVSDTSDDRLLVDVNDAFLGVFGYSKEDVIGKRVRDLELFADTGRQSELVEELYRSGRVANFEFDARCKDGTIRKGMFSGELIESQGGSYFLAVMVDITELRRVESLLRASEERWQFALEGSGDGIWDWDAVTNEVFYSHRWKAMLGYSDQEIGNNFSDWDQLIHPDDREHAHAEVKRHLLGQTPVYVCEHRLRCKDGTYNWILSRGKIIQWTGEGNPLRVIGTHTDISERKEMEEALRKSEERLTLALKATRDAVWDYDVASGVIYHSPRWWDIIGYREGEIEIGPGNWKHLMHPDDVEHYEGVTVDAINGDESFDIEGRFLHKDGHYVPVHTRGFVLRDSEGKAVRVAGTNTDLSVQKKIESERRLLEQKLQQAQKAESLGRMAGAIAHHYNNQLTVVMGNLELALANLKGDTATRNYLFDAMQATRRSAEVSGLMLTYLGQNTGRREIVDISSACRDNINDIAEKIPQGVLIEADFTENSATAATAAINASQFRQVLSHLVTNSVEAIGDGPGRIRLKTSTVKAAEIALSSISPGEWKPVADFYACLEVSDTGGGIPENDISKVFDPFFTTKFMGRGLGLAVVLGIVKAWEGAIGVENLPGGGCVFRVFLPLAGEDAADLKEKRIWQKIPEAYGGAVLLVEDQPLVRKMTEFMLEYLGFKVFSATGGAEGLELFDKHRDIVRFVITDLTMPGMDGWDTLKAIRRLSSEMPVIMTSGYDEAQVMGRESAERPQAFLHKPYSLDDLKKAVAQTLKDEA